MNQLQLYLTISSNGYRNMLDINADESVSRHVRDVTEVMRNIDYDPTEKKIFYLLKYIDNGIFIIVLRTIPDNPDDHLASWIYVPSDLDISDTAVYEAVDMVVQTVYNPKITNDAFNALRKHFAKEYETLAEAPMTVANTGRKYAFKWYGQGTGNLLSDFIGNKRYQTSYLQYEGVVLADKKDARAVNYQNITNEPLEQMVTIFPPQPDDKVYKPWIYGHVFDRPFMAPLMGTVEIVWKSDRAVDIRQSIMVSKPGMRPENISDIQARQARGQQTEQPAGTASTPEEETAGTETPRAAHEPETSGDIQAPRKEKSAPSFNYDDRQKVYSFEIPAKSAAISGMIKFEIHTRNELNESPIDGYELTDSIQEGKARSNHLIFNSSLTSKPKLIWGAAGFALGVLLTAMATCALAGGGHTDTAQPDSLATETRAVIPAEEVRETPAETETARQRPADADVSAQAAIRYLDTHSIWEKATMETYPSLKGLYDDMNNIDRKRLVEHWGPLLKESRQFGKIVEHSRLGLKANKKPRIASGGPKFNKAGDTKIFIRSYLNTIDP